MDINDSDIRIKILEEKDISDYKNIRLDSLKEFPDYFLSSYQEEVIMNDDYFLSILKNNIVCGIYYESKLVGIANINLYKPVNISHRAKIWGVYVYKNYQGRGFAIIIMNFALDYLKNNGRSMIHLATITTNDIALLLYKKLGFEVESIQKKHSELVKTVILMM